MHRFEDFRTQWEILQHRFTEVGGSRYRDGGRSGLRRRCWTMLISFDFQKFTFRRRWIPNSRKLPRVEIPKIQTTQVESKPLACSLFLPLILPTQELAEMVSPIIPARRPGLSHWESFQAQFHHWYTNHVHGGTARDNCDACA